MLSGGSLSVRHLGRSEVSHRLLSSTRPRAPGSMLPREPGKALDAALLGPRVKREPEVGQRFKLCVLLQSKKEVVLASGDQRLFARRFSSGQPQSPTLKVALLGAFVPRPLSKKSKSGRS